MTIELRHYQDQAIDAVLAEWAEGHRATLLVAATGLGKTTMFAELLRRRAPHGRSLVIAHREELINQAAARIEAQTGLTVGVEMADSRSSHLQPQQVVVATMQTLRGKRLGGFPKDAFATIVIDEAHRSLAKSYRTIADHFAGAKLLGVTATPDRSDKLGLGAVYQSVAYQYDIAEAIADGWLVPLTQHRVHCSALDVSQVRSHAGDLSEADLQQAINVDAVLHQMAKPLADLTKDRQTLVFMPGVDACHGMASVLSGYTQARIEVIVGNTPPEQRKAALAAYQAGEVQYLVNCMVLTEGFDAPSTGAIACCRPTKARNVYVQQVGRGLRLSPGKVDCLVLDFHGNSGRHRLVCPADVLGGATLPPDVYAELTGMGSVAEDIAQAQAKVAERKAKADAAKAAKLAAKERARVWAQSQYHTEEVNPFAGLGVTAGRGHAEPPASAKQRAFLEQAGIKLGEADVGIRSASKAIDAVLDRKRKGLCSYKQARILTQRGYDANVSTKEASAIIDRIREAEGWKRSA